MKKILTVLVLTAALLAGGIPSQTAQAGQKEWATAGKVLTGVLAAGLLVNGCATPPPSHRQVTYYQQPARRSCAPPVERHYSRHASPYRHDTYRSYTPPTRYVEKQVIVIQSVPSTETVWVVNSNGSRTPVELRRADGGMYVGPKGEYYTGLPTNEQLRQVYGM